jgi:hypothetical protein
MPQISIEKVDTRKLARAYIALALAQDEAKRYAWRQSAQQPGLLSVLKSLDITAELLEEVLEEAWPEKDSPPATSITCSEMLM